MKKKYKPDGNKESISKDTGESKSTEAKKKKGYYMDEAEYRQLEMHFEMMDKMNRMVAMIEYSNPQKRKEFQKWLSDNFVSDK